MKAIVLHLDNTVTPLKAKDLLCAAQLAEALVAFCR
jgi:hypothetical protein